MSRKINPNAGEPLNETERLISQLTLATLKGPPIVEKPKQATVQGALPTRPPPLPSICDFCARPRGQFVLFAQSAITHRAVCGACVMSSMRAIADISPASAREIAVETLRILDTKGRL